jgi:ribonuclease-3
VRPGQAFAERLRLPVRDLDLLEQALVHSSWLHEHPDAALGHNERLEFLGDAVVNLSISEALYTRHPRDDEGELSARRAAIVSTAGLAMLAGRIDLGPHLLLGEGESQRSERRRPSLLVLEAPVISLKSPKSRLQEYTQRRSGERPEYRLVHAFGPDHDKSFEVDVVVDGLVLGVGTGATRREAETEAAARALESLAATAAEHPRSDERAGTADGSSRGSGDVGGPMADAIEAAMPTIEVTKR